MINKYLAQHFLHRSGLHSLLDLKHEHVSFAQEVEWDLQEQPLHLLEPDPNHPLHIASIELHELTFCITSAISLAVQTILDTWTSTSSTTCTLMRTWIIPVKQGQKDEQILYSK